MPLALLWSEALCPRPVASCCILLDLGVAKSSQAAISTTIIRDELRSVRDSRISRNVYVFLTVSLVCLGSMAESVGDKRGT